MPDDDREEDLVMNPVPPPPAFGGGDLSFDETLGQEAEISGEDEER
jgi:hypothetical protein